VPFSSLALEAVNAHGKNTKIEKNKSGVGLDSAQ